jgi:AcrR family transcriptional regulator
MTVGTGKSDLRIVKTARLLNDAMSALLERDNFRKITVRDICETAQVSRATFYARFDDKYDFLKSWLTGFRPDGIDGDDYEKTDRTLNHFIHTNRGVIQNLIYDADDETVEILCAFVLSAFRVADGYDDEAADPGRIVVSNFFAGGMIQYLRWQARNKFPPHVMPVNKYLRGIIRDFREWETKAAGK